MTATKKDPDIHGMKLPADNKVTDLGRVIVAKSTNAVGREVEAAIKADTIEMKTGGEATKITHANVIAIDEAM